MNLLKKKIENIRAQSVKLFLNFEFRHNIIVFYLLHLDFMPDKHERIKYYEWMKITFVISLFIFI